MSEESTLIPLLKMQCPKCHKGKMFLTSNPFNISRVHEMPETCPECGQPNQPEPGFYTGAMYVNYGITVVLTAICYIILEIVLKVSATVFFSAYLFVLFLIGPYLFRYSRVIFLYMFVTYDKDYIKKHK